jgi:hypothetical protein
VTRVMGARLSASEKLAPSGDEASLVAAGLFAKPSNFTEWLSVKPEVWPEGNDLRTTCSGSTDETAEITDDVSAALYHDAETATTLRLGGCKEFTRPTCPAPSYSRGG